jgi:Bacterial SH3 domain
MFMKKVLLASIAALLMATSAAHTDTEFCVVVRKTPDGFLALREKPTTKSKIIATLRTNVPLLADHEDQYLEEQEYRLYKNWTHWTRVRAWVTEQDADPTKGWVYNKYIKKVPCTPAEGVEDILQPARDLLTWP